MATQFKIRRDTAANWSSTNPTLGDGEPALETDTRKTKIGNGVTAWNSLAYDTDPSNTVFLTTAQTLTNKTLTSPVVNTPTVTSATSTDGSFSYPTLAGALEVVSVPGSAPGANVTLDAMTATRYLYMAHATSNIVLNLRGNASTTLNTLMATGESILVEVRITNGTTPYYVTSFQIDGTTQSLYWINGLTPTAGNASSTDAYLFDITKTANNTYRVQASRQRYAL